MKERHLQDLKTQRDALCRKKFGTRYEYDPGEKKIHEYQRLKQFYNKNPDKKKFTTKHCREQTMPLKIEMNDMKTHYTNIDSEWKCKRVGGVWDSKGLSRQNHKFNTGVCFESLKDKQCSQHECKSLMKWFHKSSSIKPRHAEIIQYRRACDKSKNGCTFNKRKGECFHMKKVYDAYMKERINAAKAIQGKARLFLQKKAAERERIRRNKAVRKIQTMVRKNQTREILPSDWPENLRSSTVQKYIAEYYSGKKNRLPYPSNRTTPSKNMNRCSSGLPSKLSKTQSLLYSIAKGYSTGVTKQPRGLLCWHSTGSGKTCSAACIMQAFWNTNKNIVFCTSVEAKAANPPEAFVKCIQTFFKNGVSTVNAFLRRVHFFSFAQLAHYAQLYKPSGPAKDRSTRTTLLKDAVLIIDEVQNLLNPIPNQVNEHRAIQKFLKKKNTNTQLNVFVLTATPGNDVTELNDILDIVHPNRNGHEDVRGMIQYLNTNEDLTRFPSIAYKEHRLTIPANETKAYISATPIRKSKTVGQKVDAIQHQVQKNPNEKHYIYSKFYRRNGVFGVIAVQRMLESLGYKQVLPNKTYPTTKGKRYCIMTTTQLTSKSEASKLVNYFNHDNNIRGEYCQIMLASQKFNEGLDLKAVRHIHIMEPLSMAAETQTIGRARRYCSHKQYTNMKDWTVHVHRYIHTLVASAKDSNVSLNTTKKSQDEQNVRMYEMEAKPMKDQLALMKKSSIDYNVYQSISIQ